MSNISGDKNPIIETPENYADMIEKLRQREAEAEEKVKAKHDAKTLEDLKKISQDAIEKRAQRSGKQEISSESPIIKNPTNPDVVAKRDELDKELDAFAQQVMKQFPNLSSEIKLRGRIKQTGTAA